MPLRDEALTEFISGAAIEVHRHLGPGLLESAYRRCLVHELRLRDVSVASQVSLDLEPRDPPCTLRAPSVPLRVSVVVHRVNASTRQHPLPHN